MEPFSEKQLKDKGFEKINGEWVKASRAKQNPKADKLAAKKKARTKKPKWETVSPEIQARRDAIINRREMSRKPLGMVLPLRIESHKGEEFILNLNKYRNAHWTELGAAKKNYAALVQRIIDRIVDSKGHAPKYDRVGLIYTLYHETGNVDVSNPLCIIEKFTNDALTKAGLWVDDNRRYVFQSLYQWGYVDKDDPRCELDIVPGGFEVVRPNVKEFI